MRYALVKDGLVESVILWDGETEYEIPEGCSAYEVSENVSPGWTFENDEWIVPSVQIAEPTSELVAIEEAKETALLELTALGVSEATARVIVGLPPLDI